MHTDARGLRVHSITRSLFYLLFIFKTNPLLLIKTLILVLVLLDAMGISTSAVVPKKKRFGQYDPKIIAYINR
jgi:hypothetical protein